MREIKKIRLSANSQVKIVKGRKEYPCEWCGENTLKGEKHYYHTALDLYARYRFHKECYDWAKLDERHYVFGFKCRRNKRIEQEDIDNRVKKDRVYICCFWEAVQVPGQRDSVPVKRKVEIITTSNIEARKECFELYKVARFVSVKDKSLIKKENKVVHELENIALKKRLNRVLQG